MKKIVLAAFATSLLASGVAFADDDDSVAILNALDAAPASVEVSSTFGGNNNSSQTAFDREFIVAPNS